MSTGRLVVLLETVHDVMKAERTLRDAGVWCDMVPTPRELSSDCGMALEVDGADVERVANLLNGARLPGLQFFGQKDGKYVDHVQG